MDLTTGTMTTPMKSDRCVIRQNPGRITAAICTLPAFLYPLIARKTLKEQGTPTSALQR